MESKDIPSLIVYSWILLKYCLEGNFSSRVVLRLLMSYEEDLSRLRLKMLCPTSKSAHVCYPTAADRTSPLGA